MPICFVFILKKIILQKAKRYSNTLQSYHFFFFINLEVQIRNICYSIRKYEILLLISN